MSRQRPSDNFTRFTATSPHASAKSSAPSSFSYQPPPTRDGRVTNSPFNAGGPPNETPKEKVARLRAAARAAKAQNNMSTVDRIINSGRIWADVSHRVVTYGLIGFTGLATVFSFYGLTSLVLHNRRQKRAWIEREMQRLTDARAAFLRGSATPEQLHLLEQERAGEDMARKAAAEKQRKEEASLWRRAKSVFTSSSGEKGVETVQLSETTPGPRLLEETRVERQVETSSFGDNGVVAAVKEDRRIVEQATAFQPRGGPLDVLASNVTGAMTARTDNSWTRWLRGGDRS